MSKDQLLAQGSILIKERSIRIHSFQGYIIEAKRQNFQDKFLVHTLLFGDDSTSYVVQSVFPESDKDFEIQSRRLLLEVAFKPVVPMRQNPYAMDLDMYQFEFAELKDGINFYKALTKGGETLWVSVDHFVTKGNANDPVTIFYRRMQRLPYSSVQLDEEGIVNCEVNGLPGVHAKINAMDEAGNPVYLYQLLLNENEKYFLIQGISPSKEGVMVIRELTQTFRAIR